MAAAQAGPLPQLKLASGPSPATAEQRYWRGFRNQLLIPSATGYPVTSISCSGECFVVTTGTRVQVYSSRTRKLLKTMTRFGDVARSGDMRRDGRVLVAGDDTGKVQVFDVGSRAILKTWTGHGQPVWRTRFSPARPTTVLSASDDRTVRLWDLAGAGGDEAARTFAGHGDYVRCADFVPGAAADVVVSGGYDGAVKLWDARAGGAAAVMTFRHAAPVEEVLPLPSGTAVVAAAGSAVSVLDLVAGRALRVLANHQRTVTSLSLASGGRRVVTGGLEGHVKVFETTGWNVVSGAKYQSPVLSLRVVPSRDGDRHLAGERPWHKDLRHARYARALDRVLDRSAPGYTPLDVLALLLALRHRGAVRDALDNRDEQAVEPVLRWVCGHVCDPRYVGVCVEVGLHLIDMYAEHVGASPELHESFARLHRRVKSEVRRAQVACQTGGMLESLMMGAM
ncbi:WD40 repeat-like-containing domain protein [Metarhizium album ARSEF 1941]|uniref:WD40 repeat-like-containing domain protein n=1 Tax=Metarhizium album (strain ARSEF 1941) TaxID=1081103 RepID=A0A0B2WSC8_METAS|nr:WD40 repeat-like-containing domain protein [Metarhizium album ARSEF 1941]KHN96933.1 WD40 repeat-like-containing domain protein [Metarhizium album ARSEF 1941]